MKFNYRLYLAIALVSFCGECLTAQNIAAKHFGVEDGLPSSECYWVTQDSRHFLWIATDAGVVKYDGYTFVTYNSSKGLPDNTVFKIHEDRHGRIWFSTYSGKFAYYLHETDSIYIIPANKTLNEHIKLLPIDFCFDSGDTLWASLQLGGYVKVPPPFYKDFTHYRLPVAGLFLKKFDGGHFIYGSDKLANKPYPVGPFYLISNQSSYESPVFYMPFFASLTSAVQLGRQDYLFSNGMALYRITDGKRTIVNYAPGFKNPLIISMYEDTKKRVWINTNNDGTLVLDQQLSGRLYKFFPGNIGTCTFEDSDHGYWFTTTNNGLNYMPSLKFSYYNSQCGLSSDKVYSIAILNDKLYCTVNNTVLNILDLGSKKFTYKTGDTYGSVYGFGHTLLLTHEAGSTLEDETEHSVIHVTDHQNNRSIPLKKVIEAGADSLIGFDPSSEFFIISRKTGAAVSLCKVPSRASSIYRKGEDVFIGTKQGLYRLAHGRLVFLGDSVPLLANRIEALAGKGEMIFIATKGFGVLCYQGNRIVGTFNEANGLASDICKCIAIDSMGNIWVGTNRGLSRITRGSDGRYHCKTIDISDGLVSNEINQVLEYRHTVYVATNAGIGEFGVDEAFGRPKPVPVYIENFSVNNKPLDPRYCHDLKYYDNFIRINYKGVCLKNGPGITYKYRLEGLDTSWMYTRNTFVQFTTLPAGHYTFVVHAMIGNDVLSLRPATMVFNVEKAFWKTWWFMLLLLLAVATALYALYKKRIAGIRRKEAEKTAFHRQLAESELKALRSQMNPHFIFNAMNSIQNFIIKNEAAEAQKYLTKFSRLIRSVLEDSTQETILLSKEIETLHLYMELEALRASFDFDYEIRTDSSLANRPVYIPTMLLQPYVENAILHGLLPLQGRRGLITVTFEESQGSLICTIDDNGIGREKAREIRIKKGMDHKSMAMSVTSERIEHLNKRSPSHALVRIIDKYGEGQAMGTTVIIEIKP